MLFMWDVDTVTGVYWKKNFNYCYEMPFIFGYVVS